MNRLTPSRALQSLKYVKSFKPRRAPVISSSRSASAQVGGFPNLRPLPEKVSHPGSEYQFVHSPDAYVNKRTVLKVGHNHASLSFGTFWLRDSCQCSKCIHPETRQRALDTFSIPTDVNVQGITYDADGALVEWTDGHTGFYPFGFLRTHANPTGHRPPPNKTRSVPQKLRSFESHHPASKRYPTIPFRNVMEKPDGVYGWLEMIYIWGFCFVSGVPVDPESTQKLLEKISFVRNTHYGGFWDFTADLTYKDTAYTTEFLGAHTDNTYFTDPARLQLFHLLSHTDGDGGASLLVDGFQAASVMRDENPDNLHILQAEHQPFHSSGNDDVCITPIALEPVVKVNPTLRRIYQIRWNNYDRAVKRDWSLQEQNKWYTAARHWNDIITRPSMEIWTQLQPGTALIFDNWRMMHGRSQFTGKRRMCGGYINNDDFISKYRLEKFGREHVLQHLGNTYPDKWNPFNYL